MPYFVFKISNEEKPEFLQEFEKYKDARALCRDLRMNKPEDEEFEARLVFAKDRKEGRRLLSDKRKPPTLEEWEA